MSARCTGFMDAEDYRDHLPCDKCEPKPAKAPAARLDFIETYTGKRFRPLDPVVADICIEDIAHALSNQCRFSGHTKMHYSVAEHSVRVTWLLQVQGHDIRTQLWGLLHDASEAYLVDLPSPLKHSPEFLSYRIAEKELMFAVCERFDLPLEEPEVVRYADAVLLATEARDLMPFRPEHWGALKVKPLPERINPWTQGQAEMTFLKEFARLTR